MEQKHNLQLIEGTFTPEEGSEILFDLINSKIRYHNIKILSIRERSNGEISHSEKRIEQLKEARRSLREIINFANKKKLQLHVKGTIEITLTE